MPPLLPSRMPHPIRDPEEALQNRRTICEVRGYCGPFINEHFYNAYPDPMWHGLGECLLCCSTRRVSAELAKQEQGEERTPPRHDPS